ncbi:MAG: shikimate kinase [Chitinophagaceae bacterium]
MRIFLIGFMGSGKSTWGKKLGEMMGMKFVDLDTVIEERTNMDINGIFRMKGESFFRKIEAVCLRLLAKEDNMIIACGGGTPCFHDNISEMNSSGITVWLNTPKNVIASRLLDEAEHRPLVRDLNPEQLTEFIEDKLEERMQYYGLAQIVVDTTISTPEELYHQLSKHAQNLS